MPEYQPVVFDNNILTILNDYGVKPSKCTSLKSFYSDYKRAGLQLLEDYDLIIADLTRYFILEK
jgi:hypothetical protein